MTYRKLKSIHVNVFKTDIFTSDILNSVKESSNVNELVDAYNNGLPLLLKSKSIVLRPMNPWYSQELYDAKFKTSVGAKLALDWIEN
jgi:hypothetical protein